MGARARTCRVFPRLAEACRRVESPIAERGGVMELTGGLKLHGQVFRDLLRVFVFFDPFIVGQRREPRLDQPLVRDGFPHGCFRRCFRASRDKR